MAGQYNSIPDCPTTNCPFYPFRMGKGQGKGSRLKAIRKRCLDCTGSSDEVKKCNSYKNNPDGAEVCPLYFYRLGKNPKLKGKKIAKSSLEALNKYRFSK